MSMELTVQIQAHNVYEEYTMEDFRREVDALKRVGV